MKIIPFFRGWAKAKNPSYGTDFKSGIAKAEYLFSR
jgi:hypothetical protein